MTRCLQLANEYAESSVGAEQVAKVLLRVAVVGSAALAASISVSAQVSKTVNFEERPGPETLTSDGADVTVQARDEGDEMISMAAAIRVPGYQPLIVEDEVVSRAGYERWVALGKLSTADPAPSVLMAAFTGGALAAASTCHSAAGQSASPRLDNHLLLATKAAGVLAAFKAGCSRQLASLVIGVLANRKSESVRDAVVTDRVR